MRRGNLKKCEVHACVCGSHCVCVSQRHSKISFYEETKVFPSVSSIPECVWRLSAASSSSPHCFMKNVYIPSPHTPPPPPTTSLRPRPHPHCREGETVKKRQETLSCYIITTPGIMCTLIKIHVFSPPPTLADHRERGDLLVYWRSPVGLSPGLGQERGVKEVAAGGGGWRPGWMGLMGRGEEGLQAVIVGQPV